MRRALKNHLKSRVAAIAEILLSFLHPGITNYEEYSLIQESVEEKKEDGMGTLKKDRTLLRDERKMEKLKAKLHTDDDCEQSRGVDVEVGCFARFNSLLWTVFHPSMKLGFICFCPVDFLSY